MTHLYQPRDIEQKWQKAWEAKNVYAFDLEQAKDPFYLLVMFPYPSGAKLHVGHWFQYSIPDSYGRFLRMRGKEVFHPMGFDAFGLPAENYAIKTGTPPAMSTRENVTNMIEQYKKMGVMYDWNYALNTSEPEYYKWTQWLFLQMFKNQLAYKKLGNVNWCPKDQTVLANEQVHDGVCERCGTEVIQKPLEQWYWQITKYAEALLNGLDGLEWPEKTKLMQRNWIGKSEGAELMFEVAKNDQDEKRPPKAGLTGDSYSTDKPIDVSRGVNPPANMRTCHLVFTPLKRMHAFEDSGAATQILRALKDVALQQDILIHEAAAMPDHVHLLVSFKKGRNLEHDIVMRLKGTSSRLFKNSEKGEISRLWGEGKHFEEIESQKQFHDAIAYIRNNPEKANISSVGRILSQLPEVITVFTTRPDTLFGATYMVLAPEHPLVDVITSDDYKKEVDAYKKAAAKKTEMQRKELNKDKTGVFTGAFAINPVNNEKMPIWIADYALMNYGTGAVMGVPGHDGRDWEFAKKYDLPISIVVKALAGKYVLIEKSLTPEDIQKALSFGKFEILKSTDDWGNIYSIEVHADQEDAFIEFVSRHLLIKDKGGWYTDSMGTSHVIIFPNKAINVRTKEDMQIFMSHGQSIGIPAEQLDIEIKPFSEDGVLVNSDFLNGLQVEEAKKKMIDWLESRGKGKRVINYRLRDWLVSRQRYWGAPIPVVYDPEGKPHPVPEEHLPWLLPTDVEFKPTGESPLRQSKEFIERTEKIFGKGWTPEFDTMDTFVCSSFYYLRFLMSATSGDRKNQDARTKMQEDFVNASLEKKFLPVDLYIGGPEHATMHLIYARFVMMALKDMGVTTHDEPFKRLVHQGLITNQGAKMSKSKGNVVSPDDFVEKYGADVFRMFLMFMGPFTDGGDWSDTGIKGIDRFVQRMYRLFAEKSKNQEVRKEVTAALHAAIKKVTEDIERMQFNTAISAMMELLNFLEKQEGIDTDTAKTIAILMAPLAPHLAEELWQMAGGDGFVIERSWPSFDPALLVYDSMTIVVQVNGKVRASLTVPADMAQDQILAAAKAEPNVTKYFDGKQPKKEIYVPGKLVSFVL